MKFEIKGSPAEPTVVLDVRYQSDEIVLVGTNDKGEWLIAQIDTVQKTVKLNTNGIMDLGLSPRDPDVPYTLPHRGTRQWQPATVVGCSTSGTNSGTASTRQTGYYCPRSFA